MPYIISFLCEQPNYSHTARWWKLVQIKRSNQNSKRSVNESQLCNLNLSEVLNLHIKDLVLAPERRVAMEWESINVEKERKPKAENKTKPNTQFSKQYYN